MAQLLGICCEDVVEIDFAFKGSAGIGDKNPDGWGYAFSKNDYWVVDKEPFEEDKFDKKEFSLRFPANFFSNSLISHIRFASKGRQTLENTHPFDQELFEKRWVFAHIGHLQMYRHVLDTSDYLNPKGETDSEEIFCSILGDVKTLGKLAADKEIAKRIDKTAKELSKQGGLNFLLSDKETLFAYYSGYKTLYYTELRPPYETNLVGENNHLWFTLFVKGQDVQISIIASEPLIKDVHWKELDMNTLYSFRKGKRFKFVM
ncbi:MAG: class II glutamine amidotransferase [Candidatus Heimdallarchaeaceae archaeon]